MATVNDFACNERGAIMLVLTEWAEAQHLYAATPDWDDLSRGIYMGRMQAASAVWLLLTGQRSATGAAESLPADVVGRTELIRRVRAAQALVIPS